MHSFKCQVLPHGILSVFPGYVYDVRNGARSTAIMDSHRFFIRKQDFDDSHDLTGLIATDLLVVD